MLRLMFATGSPSVEYMLAHNTSESLEEIISYHQQWERVGGSWEQTALQCHTATIVAGIKGTTFDMFMPNKRPKQSPVNVFATICMGAGANLTHGEFRKLVGNVTEE